MRRHLTPAALTLGLLAALAPAHAANPCDNQPVHTYAAAYWNGIRSVEANVEYYNSQKVVVWDTNVEDCLDHDGVPGDFDGNYDAGVGGTFFGYGAWAEEPACNYALHVQGAHVAVSDFVFQEDIAFITAEDDQGGPTMLRDPVTDDVTCATDGLITPCTLDGACGPGEDEDDCVSVIFVGRGATCGQGGGDGGYWVILMHFVEEANGGRVYNPPTFGTITAS